MHRIVSLLAAFACLFNGCGSVETSGLPVHGRVTFKGAPLDKGTIQFSPATPDLATASGASIEGGMYAVPPEGGLAPGEYDVRISSAVGKSTLVESVPGAERPVYEERIPPNYNVKTTLKFAVRAGVDNEYDVDIP